ncbi:MAG TPA: cytochrome d ubiquinol oxidase subunit II [Longimicrobiales bacterium]|nr:cytochrome d ubiquinol oxidase subunit II [Longimicrobiales bacterium]
MSPEMLVAALGVVALIAYAVLGGADFGGGIWDLFATGPRRAAQREAIAHAMGPVWEANHVWLIFVIVIIFSAFPRAYEQLSIALFVPFHLVLLGIILRGAAFVFRAYSPQSVRDTQAGDAVGGVQAGARRWGAVFGIASVITPLLLGMCLGGVSAGAGAPADSTAAGAPAWLAPVSLLIGALALALCAYLAAVFLANETSGPLRDDFRSRALLAGTVVVVLSAGALPLVRSQAPHLWQGLIGGPATPVVVLGVIAALLSGWWLRERRYRLARISSVVQIACLLAGWAIAQSPYIIYPGLTLADAAAPRSTLLFILWSTPAGMALLLPSLWLLFRVFKGEHMSLDADREA